MELNIKKIKSLSFLCVVLFFFAKAGFSQAADVSSKLKGRILLQVEAHGEAWYVDPLSEERFYLGRPSDAFRIMRELGLGITNANLNKIAAEFQPDQDLEFAKKLSGKILLQVEAHGEAWYVNPQNYKKYFLGRPDDAFKIMRELGLGIKDNDLDQIKVSKNSKALENEYVSFMPLPGDDEAFVTGMIVDSSGKLVTSELITWIKDVSSEKIISYYPIIDGKLRLEKLNTASYMLEIWRKDDLQNEKIVPSPLYLKNFTFTQTKLDLGTLLIALPQKEEITQTDSTKTYICNGKNFIPCENGLTLYCPPQGLAECRKLPSLKPEIDVSHLEEQIHAMLNYERRKNEVPPLRWNDKIADIARLHSGYMANKNTLTCEEDNCDLLCRFNKNSYLESDFAESVFSRYTFKSIYPDGVISEYDTQFDIAQAIVTGWMNDAANRSLILSSGYEDQGIGIFLTGDSRLFVTNDSSILFTPEEKNELKKLTLSLITANDDRRTKIKKVHDWITSHIAYDSENFVHNSVPSISYTAIGAYRNKTAVCQGYAELFRVMLSYLGIPSEVVGGEAYSLGKYEDHAWNKINLDGVDFFVDSTWDAGYVQNGKFTPNPHDAYFLLPKTCIAIDHAEKGEKQKTLAEQKQYLNENEIFFEENCSALKKIIEQ